MNPFLSAQINQIRNEHEMIIGIIINGCRYPRPPTFDEYLFNIYSSFPRNALFQDISPRVFEHNAGLCIDPSLLLYYTDEHLSDILILLRTSHKRFDPAAPLRKIAIKKHKSMRSLLKMFPFMK